MARGVGFLIGVAWIVVASGLASDGALACACCSNRATRIVGVQALDDYRRHEIERVTFATQAFVAHGADDHPDVVRGLGTTLRLAVTRSGSDMVFAFRGASGGATSLTLALPQRISIFEIDPRDGKDEGLGPLLYKEWQLTGAARASGAFQALIAKGRTVSLILHGRGRGCTEASDFTHWTLLIEAPAGRLTLYGALTPPR